MLSISRYDKYTLLNTTLVEQWYFFMCIYPSSEWITRGWSRGSWRSLGSAWYLTVGTRSEWIDRCRSYSVGSQQPHFGDPPCCQNWRRWWSGKINGNLTDAWGIHYGDSVFGLAAPFRPLLHFLQTVWQRYTKLNHWKNTFKLGRPDCHWFDWYGEQGCNLCENQKCCCQEAVHFSL